MKQGKDKATFIAHLLWLDFVYRAKLITIHPISPARLTLWLAWLEAVLQNRDAPLHTIKCMIDELERHEPEDYALFLARCTDRDQWYRRWLRLLSLAVKSDAVDEVGADITKQGVKQGSQGTLQAFLWSTKGLEC